MYRLILLVSAGAVMASGQISAAFWPQVAVGPPGTNDTVRTEVVPNAPAPGPAGGMTGVITGGAIGVPVPGQSAPGAPPVSAPGGVPSIVMGPATGPGGSTAGGTSAGSLTPVLRDPASQCQVTLSTLEARLGPNGGPVDIAIAPLPGHCQPPVAASGTWLQLAKDGIKGNLFRFSAAPNTSPVARTANVVIGNQVFTVQQAGLIRTRLAASPGRVVVGISPKYPREKRKLSIWTDNSSPMTLTPTAKWIRVEANRRSMKSGTRIFEVTVESAALGDETRQEGAIIVSADGAPPLTIPVIAERISIR